MAKIVHLSAVHSPHHARIVRRECKTLVEAGHDAVFVARHATDEILDGVRIRGVSGPTGPLGRGLAAFRRMREVALEEAADLYHVHDTALLPLALWLRRKGFRVVYEARIDEETRAHLGTLPARLVDLSERLAHRRLDGTITRSESDLDRLEGGHAALVANRPRPGELSPTAALPWPDRPRLACYCGPLTRRHGVQEMLRAIQRIPGAPIQLGLASHPGATPWPELEAEPGWDATLRPEGELEARRRELVGSARVALHLAHPHAEPHANGEERLLRYMAAGLPIVAADHERWRALLQPSGCAVFVNPFDIRGAALAIGRLMDDPEGARMMGERGRKSLDAEHEWRRQGHKLLAFYDWILDGGVRHG